jgi:hypothetical protein
MSDEQALDGFANCQYPANHENTGFPKNGSIPRKG